MDEISQISIYLKDQGERLNEISLFDPLAASQVIDKEVTIKSRQWTTSPHLSLPFKIQSFAFKHFKFLIPEKRSDASAQLRTVLATLLVQENLRDYFFKRREHFFAAIQKAARMLGLDEITLPSSGNAIDISRELTTLANGICLFDTPSELALQIMSIPKSQQNSILYEILNRVEREPVQSVLEVVHSTGVKQLELMTKYMQYRVQEIKPTGKVAYVRAENRATSTVRTRENILPDARGVTNQRLVYDVGSATKIGAYSGEIATTHNLIEQILLILDEAPSEVYIVDQTPADEEKRILFTSLYSWNELGLISNQREAIRLLNGKTLIINQADGSKRSYLLRLTYFNIPFNNWNRFPTPSETRAVMDDVNEEALVWLTYFAMQQLGMPTKELEILTTEICSNEPDFLKRQQNTLAAIDAFRLFKGEIVMQLQDQPKTDLIDTLIALLTKKRSDQKGLKGIDELLYLNQLASLLGCEHNKNCQNATRRSAGAKAADKAQHAFYNLKGKSFLPGRETEDEQRLFQTLYSMYLVWEEPGINSILSSGDGSKKQYHNFVMKNPETSRYLIRSLKKNPELYLN